MEQRYSPTLNQIESHMPVNHSYREPDKVTHAHETVQGLSAQLRSTQQQVVPDAAFVIYVTDYGPTSTAFGNGMVYVFCPLPTPVTLQDVARRVPSQWRDSHYQLYLITCQQWWNNQPWFILEEMVAYWNGARVGLEYRMCDRVQQSLERSAMQYRYALILEHLSKCPSVRVFNEWFLGKLMETVEQAEKAGCGSGQTRQILAEVQLK